MGRAALHAPVTLAICVSGAALLLCLAAGSAHGAAWKPGWNHRRTITIHGSEVAGSSDHIDFPVLISGTYSSLATVAGGGDVEHPQGYDIVFTEDDGTSRLDHEIEEYVALTGTSGMWVRISAP